ncbi:MAG: P-type conjugative transfer protein TrbL [Sulfuricurvum sp.]
MPMEHSPLTDQVGLISTTPKVMLEGLLSSALHQKNNPSRSSLPWLLIFLLTFTTPIYAIENSTDILNLVSSGIGSWVPYVKQATLWVFWTLVAIDLTWTFGKMALSGFELGEFLATLIKKIMFIGVIIYLFDVSYWLNNLLSSFSMLSHSASGTSVEPNSIISGAYKIFLSIWDSTSFSVFDTGKSIVILLVGLLTIFAFVLMAIDLVIVYVKFYIMQVVIYFALALGGLEHFRQTALSPILTAIKVGIELFVIQALMGLALTSVENASTTLKENATLEIVIQILIMSMIFAVITKLVPTVVEAVMSGSIGDNSAASSGFKQVAAMAVGGVAGAAATTAANSVGVTRAMAAARDLHDAQGGDKAFVSTVKGTAKNMANAYKETMAGSFAGNTSSKRGATSHTMANSMRLDARMMREKSANSAAKAEATKTETTKTETTTEGSISGKGQETGTTQRASASLGL